MNPSVAYFIGDHRQLGAHLVHDGEELVEGGGFELRVRKQLLNRSPCGLVPTKTGQIIT
jgi:hypothetical protein